MNKLNILFVMLLLPLTLLAGDIKGIIVDGATGEPLVGANVTIEGTNKGAATDQDGYFIIEDVAAGDMTLLVSYIGYQDLREAVALGEEQDLVLDLQMRSSTFTGETITVEITRAQERRTPVTFTEVNREEILDNYTTQDVPDLIKSIPGVFTTSAGLGESEIYIRGFDAEHIQVLINGIPENDPESQVVYWSNWSGLSGNAASVQVQRGVGASLVGSGSFGGSVNIQTSQYSATPMLRVRGSVVSYATDADKSADGTGGFDTYNPANQMFALEYATGLMYDGKLNVYARYERKAGDSYIRGTDYNGHSFYLGMQSILGDHILTLNAHGAPQRHNQASAIIDPDLISRLGREYNRYNHPYQENYYFKPQFELHHDWKISNEQFLTTRAFATTGNGGGRYLRNDFFDVETGEVTFQRVDEARSWNSFGRHAKWAYQQHGVTLTGYDPDSEVFTYGGITDTVTRSGRQLTSSQFDHSWRNDSQNDHIQFGGNTAYQQKLSDMFTITVGGEARYWKARHHAQSFDFRYFDAAMAGVGILDEVQKRYDYDGIVTNLSAFGRLLVSPMENLTFMFDGQYARYNSRVEERDIRIFDFGAGKFSSATYKASESSGNFSDDDYERTFSFFMPKFGVNYNLDRNVNFFANYSISKKEPKVGDWYDRDDGPGANQIGGKDLDPETLTNIEFGLGYATSIIGLQANVYMMTFEDKIESVVNQEQDFETFNAGNADHIGFELMARGRMDQVDGMLSFSYSQNEWTDLSVTEIFGEDASAVEGKQVPFVPALMLNAELGYNLDRMRFYIGGYHWDEYYGDYLNENKLDAFLEINAGMSYNFRIGTSRVDLSLDLYNITNEDNFAKADWTRDFNRSDDLAGQYMLYVLPSPKFHTALTAQITL